ncbi:MAG TPA: LuxR C-terminal-related transcriptional regulator [Trebonia sp.]|nr:LuxR C-terminal-related transcriptional regulator [Trebonia sp.]
MKHDSATGREARFAQAKFRPPARPATLVARPALRGLLDAGASQRLTVVVGSAGAGKTVLLADWAMTRPPGTTAWLSCDRADADPVRFWAGFAEAARDIEPGFGADAADLLAMDGRMSADVTASLANDAARLPAGSAIVVDDFQYATAAAARDMTDLIERWPSETVQLVLSGRFDPVLRQHRLRMSGQLTEIRDRDLYFSLAESRDLLVNFGVDLGDTDLALLHERSEGWPAALQMAALSLLGTRDGVRAQALEVRSDEVAAYFLSEVLEQQPEEVAQFMLDTSILGTLTADACTAVTGREDAASMLRLIDDAQLFLIALDDERTSFRYHHLIRQVLRAELRARDRGREQALQLRAAEWFESAGEARRAARHFINARQADRALALLQDKVVPDFVADPVMPGPLDLAMVRSAQLAEAPDRLLAVAADLLLWGDTGRASQYLDVLERVQPPEQADPRLAARFTAIRAFQHAVTGQLQPAIDEAHAARELQQRVQPSDEWNLAVPLLLMTVHNCLEDFAAVEREAAAALEVPTFSEVVKLVVVPGARALARFGSGQLNKAAELAEAADAQARRLGFSEHFFAVDHLRALAGIALEQRDFDTAERLTERVLSITEQRRPLHEFLALLDRGAIWAARGQVRDALASVAAARAVLEDPPPVLLARADESEALIRLSAGDLHSPAELAGRLTAGRRAMLLARLALAAGDHATARRHLESSAEDALTPREDLVRQTLLAAAAIECGDPAAAGIVGDVLQVARGLGFCGTVVTSAPQVASYLIMHATQLQQDPFAERVTSAAMDVRAACQPALGGGHLLAEPLTAAEQRILKLLPTSTYLQMAATLYISRNTVKSHLRSIYQKLGAGSRSEAVERAVDLHLL